MPGQFQNVVVNPQSYVAYNPENDYSVTFTPLNQIPLQGYVDIFFPPEVIIPDPSYSQSTCKEIQGFTKDTIICQFYPPHPDTGYQQLRILSGFRVTPGEPGVTFEVKIPGIRNPIRVEPTSDFIVKSWTNDDYQIDDFSGANI